MISIQFSLHPLCKTVTWHHLYRVLHTFHSLVIEKDICDHRNVSFKLMCVCVCLSFGDLLILMVNFPIFCVIRTLILSFPFSHIFFVLLFHLSRFSFCIVFDYGGMILTVIIRGWKTCFTFPIGTKHMHVFVMLV